MAVDAIDLVDRLAGQRDERQANRDADLADDPDARVVELREQVVRLADRAGERALDRDDAGVDSAPDATASNTARQVGTGRASAAVAEVRAAPLLR